MRRPALLGAAWLAAAAAAVGLGFLAVSFVGASASPDAAFLAATGSVATSSEAGAPPPSVASAVTTARQVTPGGTVVASCTGGTAELAGAPAAGWWTDDPTDRDAVEFSNGAEKIEVRATCPAGTPSFVVEGPRASHSQAVVPQSPAVVSQSPATEDKGGSRGGGGGHGSDG